MTRKYKWSDVPAEKLNPLLTRRMLTAGNVTLSLLDLKKGSVVARHEHPNEQISYVLSGSIVFWLGPDADAGDDAPSVRVGPGEVLTIPGSVPHRVRTLEDAIVLDIFNPPRADWLSGKDAYLRS